VRRLEWRPLRPEKRWDVLPRAIQAALIILLSTDTGASMAGDLRTAGDRFILRSQAFMQTKPTTPASSGKNPYLWPGVALMVVGAGLTVYGLGPTTAHYLCPPYKTCGGTHRSTEIAVVGGVVAAAGVTLLIVGNGKKPSAPFIVLRPKGMGLGYRLEF
jgi:hypothetical protein